MFISNETSSTQGRPIALLSLRTCEVIRYLHEFFLGAIDVKCCIKSIILTWEIGLPWRSSVDLPLLEKFTWCIATSRFQNLGLANDCSFN